MGSGVNDRLDVLDAPAPAAWSTTEDRALVEQRVRLYLNALGVHDPHETEVLVRRVIERVEFRATLGQLGEPLEVAIEETHRLLDRWLVAELGLESDPDRISAARAAVLGGHVPGWTQRWAGLSEESLADSIRAVRFQAVPERAPLTMEPNPIRLCCHHLLRRFLARVGRWLWMRGRHSAATEVQA
ncbi:hypothetical protein [Allochromatium tepidum]|uniref:Uncharacterized protein n=1 Tax=Allochromatium tepidum TaxID=553982 RepID=A0ABN6GCM9_9GAMM|nr:hypothetical protein [Allochromatium tepidum]BCU07701.1 hypothetical protein Atep_23780 [Allochromatium tepidum]